MKLKTRTVLLGVAAAVALLAGRSLLAQGGGTRQVAVAVVDTLSKPGLRAEILRFSDPARPDVILLSREGANVENLAAAIAAYRESANRTPSRPGLVGRTAVTGASLGSEAGRPLRERAAQMLTTLRRAPYARVGTYGRGQWSTFEVRVGG